MKIKTTICILTVATVLSASAFAGNGISKNNAQMQAMDKITGRVSVINVPVNGMVEFGSLSIVVRSCKTRPAEETPDNFAFVDITDKTFKGEEFNIFKGWMISSSPATHAVEHPIYDVWLLKCTDEKVDKKQLLSETALAKRDSLPQLKDATNNSEKETTQSHKLTRTISEMKNEERQSNTEMQTQPEFFYDEEEASEDADFIPDDTTDTSIEN